VARTDQPWAALHLRGLIRWGFHPPAAETPEIGLSGLPAAAAVMRFGGSVAGRGVAAGHRALEHTSRRGLSPLDWRPRDFHSRRELE
jgi:hypothetical protein